MRDARVRVLEEVALFGAAAAAVREVGSFVHEARARVGVRVAARVGEELCHPGALCRVLREVRVHGQLAAVRRRRARERAERREQRLRPIDVFLIFLASVCVLSSRSSRAMAPFWERLMVS